MSDIGLVAAVSNAQTQAEIAAAIGIKVLKLANQQQESVASLVEAAVDVAAQISAQTANSIDLHA